LRGSTLAARNRCRPNRRQLSLRSSPSPRHRQHAPQIRSLAIGHSFKAADASFCFSYGERAKPVNNPRRLSLQQGARVRADKGMAYRCAILDDYQNVALKMADWSPVAKDIDIKVFNAPLDGPDKVIAALADFDIVCGMRERTPFPRAVIAALPKLKLLITTGARNASFDLEAAKERNVVVCGTPGTGNPTAGIAIGLMLELTRRIGYENARMKAGELWQNTIGLDLEGHTLGIIGLGKLGTRVAQIAKAFGMKVIAWSQNLTAEKCREAGVEYAGKEDLLRQADFITIHVVLSQRTRGLLGAKELSLMKPTAYLINTSRGPIVEEAALIAALKDKRIAGAGLDVFDVEPLPRDHALRRLDNVVLTPHLGYVSVQNYRAYFAGVVEDIRAFLDGKPVRPLT
jgi:phosphoglycerate dehydrogenase-like enzyme